jgi:erythronate-4-phosphate dehydrogenase
MGFHVVADEAIQITPALREAADSLTLLPGASIRSSDLSYADVLLVRSVTTVDEGLLDGTPVSRVGTATAGFDHLDTDYLDRNNITWASAPGVNARAVVEYVLSVLAHMDALKTITAGGLVGILGYGQVGSLLTEMVEALGGRPLVWDPWVDVPEKLRAASLNALFESPVISLHASLHSNNPWPSAGLVNQELAQRLSPEQILINAARGPLVSAEALQVLIDRGVRLALDTWPEEPLIGAQQLEGAELATSHIAGYSLEAKRRATDSLVAALWPNEDVSVHVYDDVEGGEVDLAGERWLERLLLSHYNPADDDTALRASGMPDVSPRDFERLRTSYALRRELWGSTKVTEDEPDIAVRKILDALGVSLRIER